MDRKEPSCDETLFSLSLSQCADVTLKSNNELSVTHHATSLHINIFRMKLVRNSFVTGLMVLLFDYTRLFFVSFAELELNLVEVKHVWGRPNTACTEFAQAWMTDVGEEVKGLSEWLLSIC